MRIFERYSSADRLNPDEEQCSIWDCLTHLLPSVFHFAVHSRQESHKIYRPSVRAVVPRAANWEDEWARHWKISARKYVSQVPEQLPIMASHRYAGECVKWIFLKRAT